jgi:AAA+ superfamily predicted ATPase
MPEDGKREGGVCVKRAGEYSGQWEYMEDALWLLNYRLYLFYKHHQWLGPGSELKNMLGITVSREEFEYKLARAAQRGLSQMIDEDEREQLLLRERSITVRLAETKANIRILHLFARFELTEFERRCVELAYAPELDTKYERLFAYLQDNITKHRPGAEFAARLYLPQDAAIGEYASYFERDTPFTALFERGALADGVLRLNRRVAAFLSGGEPSLPSGFFLYDGRREREAELITGKDTAAELDAIFALTREDDGEATAAVLLFGAEGAGRRFQVKQLMSRRSEACVFADLSVNEAVAEANMLARLYDAYLCFYGLEREMTRREEDGAEVEDEAEPSRAILRELDALRAARGSFFLIAQTPLRGKLTRRCVELEIGMPDDGERLALFRRYFTGMGEERDMVEMSAKFRFTPAQIARAATGADYERRVKGCADSETLHRCCRAQAAHKLDRLASVIAPMYDWDDITLPDAQKELIQRACAHIKYRHRVYQDWGFSEKISYGTGLSILFSGAPGTGKTMCAQIIAKQLGLEAYKINLAQLVSKYIGETEKNLAAVFREARRSSGILFFDECDALFGKRSEVKDAHDRNANVEVAYLLQQIEEYDGVCILASNLAQNIDAAFMRRITYLVRFPFPDAAARRSIYLKLLPAPLPLEDDVDWDYLAEKFNLSGGHIKNIVLNAAFFAASENAKLGMRHLLNAAVDELRKNDIVVVREDFSEYADLIFDAGRI